MNIDKTKSYESWDVMKYKHCQICCNYGKEVWAEQSMLYTMPMYIHEYVNKILLAAKIIVIV